MMDAHNFMEVLAVVGDPEMKVRVKVGDSQYSVSGVSTSQLPDGSEVVLIITQGKAKKHPPYTARIAKDAKPFVYRKKDGSLSVEHLVYKTWSVCHSTPKDTAWEESPADARKCMRCYPELYTG